MKNKHISQITLFDLIKEDNCDDEINENNSKCESILDKSIEEGFVYLDNLNNDTSHMLSRDDICTPMKCVQKMIDYVPEELWKRQNISVLDPCCGNGNFGYYVSTKTDSSNIYYNDFNIKRLENCKKLLNPKNISFSDAFELKGKFKRKYDLVVANPPYSGGGNKNRSLSNLFIELAIDLLNDKGYICYITPNNWMTYNNNNTTLKRLLTEGSFVVIDNDAKKYFPQVGSSFTIFVWQKGVKDNLTYVVNTFLKKDIQENVKIPNNISFIPLYISNPVLSIIEKCISKEETGFAYRCDLHHFTQKKFLNDVETDVFKYETIHTARKTCYASKKQDIYDKWVIIIPLSTYYVPYIRHNVNTTQSVGYFVFETEDEAKQYLLRLNKDYAKLIIHITRYGNFNNIMVLKHIIWDLDILFTDEEQKILCELSELIKY